MQCFSFSALKASLIDSFIATVDQKLCNVRDVADRNDSLSSAELLSIFQLIDPVLLIWVTPIHYFSSCRRQL